MCRGRDVELIAGFHLNRGLMLHLERLYSLRPLRRIRWLKILLVNCRN